MKSYDVRGCIIELTPNKNNNLWLITIDGYLPHTNIICLSDLCGDEIDMFYNCVIEMDGRYYVDNPEKIESFITVLKLMGN